jgi:FkbM family methyltransferase
MDMTAYPIPVSVKEADPVPFGAYAPKGLVRWIIARTRRMTSRWAIQRLMFVLRKIALKRMGGKPADVETLGARMRLYPYRNICEKRILFTPQLFDHQERAILVSKMREGFVFLDIGANVGAYALFVAANAGPCAKIIAIEPQPEIFDRLVYNIGQNPFGTIKAVSCAIADKPGELTLFLDPKNSGESSVKLVASSQAAAIRVPAITLMDLLRAEQIERVDAAKLDVEGAEDLILETFLNEAPDALLPQLLIIENGTKQWQVDLPALLLAKGYRLVQTTRMNLIFEKD